MESTPKVIVGLGSCGIAAGAAKVFDKIAALKKAENLNIELKKTSCIGMCYREPLIEIIDESGSYLYGDIDEEKAIEVIDKHINQHNPVKDYIVKSDLVKTEDDSLTKIR
ncbi:MAG: (2Fe-2S) ferredoxin domain-containing protein [Bacteroidota bacterium]|nr:(2Fe-2S) ferredoxin domain-containing protein [Bacteroidota bacterium]